MQKLWKLLPRGGMRGVVHRCSPVLVLLAASAVQALEPAPVQSVTSPVQVPQHAQGLPECTCRASGQDHRIGAQICLGSQMFRCSMDLNVTSWKSTGSPCPQS